MSRAEVRDNEQKRGGSLFYWSEPTLTEATTNNPGLIGSNLHYQFEDNKLIAVSEFTFYVDYDTYLKNLRKLGLPENLYQQWRASSTKGPFSWLKNGLKITLQTKSINTINGVKEDDLLTYEKAN
jgi:hypothetical protein